MIQVGLLISSVLRAQSTSQLKTAYAQIFKIEQKQYKSRTYHQRSVNKLPTSHFLAKLVNANQQYLHYLLSNFAKPDYKALKQTKSPEQLQNLFIEMLQKDDKFNQVMEKFASRVLNKSAQKPDTITTGDLMNIAAKYFTIRKITAKGQYTLKVCGGLNGIRSTEAQRNPQLEAFCFSTILKNYMNRQSRLGAEVIKNARKLYGVKLGVKKEERLLRAQGALFMLMYGNDLLKKLLLEAYETQKQNLPFIIKAEKS